MRSIRLAAVPFFICLSSVASASAQTVRGALTNAETGEPLAGAVVVLIDDAGERRAGTLTWDDGRFLLRVPEAGRYRIEAQMIGYEPIRTSAFGIAAGETIRRDLRTRVRPLDLEGITASVNPRCRPRPEATRHGQRLWEEARTALTAVSLTQDAPGITFDARLWEREVDPATGRVSAESVEPLEAYRTHPFASVPVDQLLEEGFVRERADTTTYYGPDAHVLLSDPFLSTHCFWAVEGEDGRVGLAFEPVPARRDLPEVEGTLWLDRESALLRRLEFRYTHLPAAARSHGFGGEVSFLRLGNGAWVIKRWSLRMPHLGRIAGRSDYEVLAIREVGGELVEVSGSGRSEAYRTRTGALEGRLVTTAGEPIPGGFLYLSGTQHADSTDDAGRFRISDVREGRYVLAWHHPDYTRRAGRTGPMPVVDVRAGETTVERIVASSGDPAFANGCEAGDRRPGTGVLFGTTRHDATSVRLGGSTVRLTAAPQDPSAAGGDGDEGARALETTADRAGRFRLCAVPPGEYAVVANLADQARDSARVVVAPNARVELDLALQLRDEPRSDADHGRIIGRVVDAVEGRPVASASVRVDSGTMHLTNEEGRFALADISPGTHTLAVRHVGFEPVDAAVRLEAGALLQLDVRMGPVQLDTVHVIATRRGPLADVYWRMERALGGRFITADEIQRHAPSRVTDLLRGEPGFRVISSGVGAVGRIEGNRPGCAPAVYIDGIRVFSASGGTFYGQGLASEEAAYEVVNMPHPALVEIIEIYPGPATVPAQFGGSTGGCGVIAMWMRDGPPT